ncbi:MAG: rRNA pseudouridine synthase [Oligoflexus sp.]|nr:rRNA pseudouridine synthase [Oligoflexus sp.]
MRIQKWLSQLGIASRREAEKMLLEGQISINGKVVREPGTKIQPDSDQITVKGKLVQDRQPPRVYWMLHKPDLTLTSRQREEGKITIFDLPALRHVKFLLNPVGRLDYRTEGLLLLSNDGELVHRLTHPSYKITRTYQVLFTKRLKPEEEKAIRNGITLDDGPTQGADLQFLQSVDLGNTRGAYYLIKVREGRNRIVRRTFEHFDGRVVRLIRMAFGDLALPDNLAPGDYRQLNSAEILNLKQAVGLEK